MSFPNRSQRGYHDLPYPRICTVNTLGSGNNLNGGSLHYTTETYERFGLHIVPNGTVDPRTMRNAKQDQILILYQNITQMQVNNPTSGVASAGAVIWPGWWLTNSGTYLGAAMNTTGGTGQSMTVSGPPATGVLGSEVISTTSAIAAGSGVSHTFNTVNRFDSAGACWTDCTSFVAGASILVDNGTTFEVTTITSVTSSPTTGSTSITFTATYANSYSGSPTTYVILLPFPVLISNNANHANDEVVVVTGKTATNTYTVTRGTTGTPIWGTPYGSATNPPSHSQGDRVGALCPVPAYYHPSPVATYDFYLNTSAMCPPCPRSDGTPNQQGMRWADYFAYLCQNYMATWTFTDPEGNTRTCYDGIFVDSADSFLTPNPPWLDADGNNAPDPVPGDGPSPGPVIYDNAGQNLLAQNLARGTYSGIVYALRKLKTVANPGPLPLCIGTNGSNYPGFGDGIFWENAQTETTSHAVPMSALIRLQQERGWRTAGQNRYPVTIFNFCLGGNTMAGSQVIPGQSAATSNYQNHRYYLSAVTCLTDAFYCCDYSASPHGQTWMFDEYDAAAGTCLTAQMTTASTSITVQDATVFNGLTPPFQVRIPLDYTTSPNNYSEDEVMTVTSVNTGTGVLQVTRGIVYNGLTMQKGQAQVGARVCTLAQQRAGEGWLGLPLGDCTDKFSTLGANIVTNGTFEAAASVANSNPAQQTFTGWALTNKGASSQAFGLLLVPQSGESHGGSNCVKLLTTVPSYANPFGIVLQPSPANISGSWALGQALTCSFWAKADRGQRQFEFFIRDAGNSNATLGVGYYRLTPNWTKYWLTVYIGQDGKTGNSYAGTFPATSLNFQLLFGSENGTIWIDDVQIQPGDPNVFTRDFAGGFVICNATQSSQVVTLPAITGPYTHYQKLKGSQDPTTNDGSTIAGDGTGTVTVGPCDGLFLKKA